MTIYQWFECGLISCLLIIVIEITSRILWKDIYKYDQTLLSASLTKGLTSFCLGILFGGFTLVMAFMNLYGFCIVLFQSGRQTIARFFLACLFIFVLIHLGLTANRETLGCTCKDGTYIYGNHPNACTWHGGISHWHYKYWWE